MTLIPRPASLTRFFNWLAPMRLEPMPASHTNTTSRTSAAAFSTMADLRVGMRPPGASGRAAPGGIEKGGLVGGQAVAPIGAGEADGTVADSSLGSRTG